VAALRALTAVTERRFADVEALAKGAIVAATPGAKPNSTTLLATALAEYARAMLGRSRMPTDEIAAWPQQTRSPKAQRDMSYWSAQTLLARHDATRAYSIASAAWSAPAGKGNAELRWRLAAVATLAARAMTPRPDSATIPRADDDLRQLITAWDKPSAAYLARPDLAALRRTIS
jgi:hypothetical protein